MRHRLLARLLLVSLLIVVGSIAATAWLSTLTVTRGLEQQQGRVFAGDAVIYQGLLDYAVTNRTWDGVGPVVADLAERTGLRITLTGPGGRPIAESGTGPAPTAAAVAVDPLALAPDLVGAGSRDGPIDPRVVGPFALSDAEQAQLEADARLVQACVNRLGGKGAIAVAPDGRPSVDSAPPQLARRCGADDLDAEPVGSQTRALAALQKLTNDCLAAQQQRPVTLNLDLTWTSHDPSAAAEQDLLTVQPCLVAARRQLLTPYVPPTAWLWVSAVVNQTPASLRLSGANLVRIVWVVGGVLVVASGVTVLAGVRIVRPLQALTRAARRAADGDTSVRVPARGRDEVAQLAGAFNEMAAARARLEATRKALISDIAHELRSPLTTVRGWLEATQDGLAERSAERDELLLDETLHLQRIVNDLQDLAVSDAGGLRLHLRRRSTATLIDQARATHAATAAGRGVRLDSAQVADLPLRADPERLRQILDNLIGNALRHTPTGGEVTLSCDRDDVGGRIGARIEVADTGCGISAEDLPHVFDRFWRADPSRQRGTGGSGLGLAVARSLAEAHGGTLTATSTPGSGSVFVLRLPVDEQPLDPADDDDRATDRATDRVTDRAAGPGAPPAGRPR